ncbi:MAG TPA: undecaprenyl-diphosphate phosphatase [Candidatus Paceibacterota bacterium]
MNPFDAVILGMVEGLTEFLPISSTAHLILGAKVLGLLQTDFLKSFEIIIQFGAILAVATLYFKSFFDRQILKNIIVGFIPTGILGLFFYGVVKQYLGNISVILWALFIGGVVLIIFEKWQKGRDSALRDTMTASDCIKIGLFQALSFIPGVSRSGATILGGLALGVSRKTITEYSFLLAVPTMLAATGLDAIKNKDLLFEAGNFSNLLVGFVVSYLVAILAIKVFLAYVKKHDFFAFGVYRIAIATISFFFLI